MQLRADQTLRKCAIQKGDETILAVTSRDIVAASAQCHISRYKNYKRDSTKTPENKEKGNKEKETGDLERSIDVFTDDKGKLLVVPESVSLKDVVLENQTLQRELKVWRSKSTDVNTIIDQTSSLI